MAYTGTLTPELITTICRWLEAGNTRKTAAVLSGITTDSLNQWIAQGRVMIAGHTTCQTCGAEPPAPCRTRDGTTYRRGHSKRPNRDSPTVTELCIQLVQEMEAAEERCIGTLVASWKLAARDDWRAAEKFLARKRPDEWAERHQIDVEVTAADLETKLNRLIDGDHDEA